jgi:hypothetical protein
MFCSELRLSPHITLATNWPVSAQDDNGTLGETKTGKENQSTWKKPAAVPLYAPQISNYLTWD